jgi:hypothetical protein
VDRRRLDATRAAIRTPKGAAIAGIVFAVLFTASIVLIRLSVPEDLTEATSTTWLTRDAATISLALTLAPFAGIAFLWFMGVIRARMGDLEDQFFSTVFFGSGLLFLAMFFQGAAIAGGILTSYATVSETLVESGVVAYARAHMYAITNVYGIRMAGVFLTSIGTIWLRTKIMPRPVVLLTYALALVLLLSGNLSLWLVLVFPGWVLLISLLILVARPSENQTMGDNAP